MKRPLVQILVVVANIQVRTLKAEVEKGFMRTAVDHELIDPKAQINLENGDNRPPSVEPSGETGGGHSRLSPRAERESG